MTGGQLPMEKWLCVLPPRPSNMWQFVLVFEFGGVRRVMNGAMGKEEE